jgi:TPR repeat protein
LGTAPEASVPIFLVGTAISLALAVPDSNRAAAARAVDLEFARSGASALEPERAALFASLCADGWGPACQRDAWQVRGVPDLATAAALMGPECVAGDPVACTVLGWHALITADEADVASGIEAVRQACGDGHGPACQAWGEALFRQVAVDSTPDQGVARWRASCRAREPSSCRSLAGVLEAAGDTAGARKTAAQPCQSGDLAACLLVARLEAPTWDAAGAVAALGPLCDRGAGGACAQLAAGLREGRWTGPDPHPIEQRGCALLDASACVAAATASLALSSPDDASANVWLRQGCALGDPRACALHVDRVLSGQDDTPILEDDAAFDRACLEAGHARACGALGSALQSSAGARPADAGRVRALLVASCPETDPSPAGCAALARVYEDGAGVQRDRTLAVRYYGRACGAGVADACARRGHLLLDGSGVRRDEAAALSDFESGCRLADASACLGAGDLLVRGSPLITADPARARTSYATACGLGAPQGCLALGRLEEAGTAGPADYAAAREAYERAVATGSAEGKRYLARLLWNALGGKRDRARARTLAAEACQAGEAAACRGPAAL